ncbi:MAG: hypothetical protein HGA45_01850 [Chloroflexales bacterium]|nr:hypothetical protein [Chloroflexales bacterium]
MSSIDQREEARYRQDVLVSYRAWLAYLEAQQTLLAAAAEVQSGLDPFEGLSPIQERAEAARRRLAALPADKRELFDAIYEQDRQQIQRQLDAEAQVRGGTVKRADPDEVARRALSHLHEEARGLHRDDRRGLVPRGKPDAVKWLALDLTEIEQAPPSETDYQLAGGRRVARRGLILNVVFAVLALLAIPALLFLLQQPGQTPVASGAPTGNGEALAPWPVVAVGAEDWTLAVQQAETRWPTSCVGAEASSACWLAGSFRPVELCIPTDRLAALSMLRLEAAHGLPTRVFVVSAEPPADPDLVVRPCASGTDSAPRFGRLQTLEAPPSLAPGAPAPAGFIVRSVSTRGQGDDPTLPEGRLILSVTVEDADQGRDWVALAPTVLLADGSTALPSETERTGTSLRFDYLIADQTERFDALWQVTGADQVVRYRVTLEPPPTRDTVLRAALRVGDLTVTPSQQTMAVRLTLHNAATTPLVVVPADLGFQTQTARRELAAPTLQQPLAPGERRTLTLDLPLESGVLQVGPFRYELAVRR